MRGLTAALAACVAACAAGAGARVTSPTRAPADAAVIDAAPAHTCAPPPPGSVVGREAVVRFEIDGHPTSSPFAVPVVRATLAGHPTYLVVDSGANTHFLGAALVRDAGLHAERAGTATDAADRPESLDALAHPALSLEGWGPLALDVVGVVDFPEAFARVGIGGVISPQLLAPRGEVVLLDLPGARLRGMTLPDAIARLGDDAPSLTGSWVRACSSAANDVDNVVFIAPASVSGRDATLVLDTGASGSSVLSTSSAGASLAPLSAPSPFATFGVGTQLATRIVRDGRVHVGEVDAASTIVITQTAATPGEVCPHDGLIGMDVLHRCVLVFGGSHFLGRCGG
jgi:hypothetical protein